MSARKKKTAAEQAAARKRFQHRVTHTEEQHYDNLHTLYVDCSKSFEHVKMVADIIGNKPFLSRLTPEQVMGVKVRSETILQDVKHFKQTIDDIYATHKHLTGRADNVLEVLGTFQIAEQYIQWQDSYDNIVMTAIGDFTDFCESIVDPQPVEQAA